MVRSAGGGRLLMGKEEPSGSGHAAGSVRWPWWWPWHRRAVKETPGV